MLKRLFSMLAIPLMLSATLVGVSAAPAQAHNIVCYYTPFVPAKLPNGSIQYGGRSACNYALDIRTIVFRLWRYDYNRKKYYKHSEYVVSDTTPNKSWTPTATCSTANILYSFHTEMIVDGFHGNWDTDHANSNSVNLRC